MQNEHGHTFSESFRNAWEKVKEIVGLEKTSISKRDHEFVKEAIKASRAAVTKAHSNAGVYVPLSEQHQKEWNAKGQLEKLAGSVPLTTYEQSAIKRDANRNENLKTVNTLSPAEINRSQERHMKQHPEHSYGVSHHGKVREATTGNTYNRLGSEEKMAKGYAEEAIKPPKQELSL